MPLWLFFALEEHMYSYSIATYVVLTLFWVRFYKTILMKPGLAFMDKGWFTIVALLIPTVYSMSVSIYFYYTLSSYEQGLLILRKYFYIFHVGLFSAVSFVLLYVAMNTYLKLEKLPTRKFNKIKTVKILTMVGLFTVFKSIVYAVLTILYDTSTFGNFYWNTCAGVYIFFFAEHFIPSTVFLILLRRRPKLQRRLPYQLPTSETDHLKHKYTEKSRLVPPAKLLESAVRYV